MTTPDDSFLKYNAYITATAGVNPAGAEVGFAEETAEILLINLAKPTTMTASDGRALSNFTHGLSADALDRLWRRAVADGFDISTAAKSLGQALIELRLCIDETDPQHADYDVGANDWYALETRTGSGANHWMYNMLVESSVGDDGRLRSSSIMLSYVSERHLAAKRHEADGTVLPMLMGMLQESIASGPAMRAAASGADRADVVLDWLRETELPAELYEFLFKRSGAKRRQLRAELEHRAMVAKADPSNMDGLLKGLLVELLPELPALRELLTPQPSRVELRSLVGRLWEAAQKEQKASARGMKSYDDVKTTETLASSFLALVRAEEEQARARAAAGGAGAAAAGGLSAAEKVKLIEDELLLDEQARRTQPKQRARPGQ